jgi:L-fuconolactonase
VVVTSPRLRVLDSHIHFWDTGRFDYPWLRAHPPLERPFLPTHLDVAGVEVEAFVFVQANPVWEQVDDETAWVLRLGADDGRIQALVAGVPLDRGPGAVAPALERLSRLPGVAGVRQLIQDEPEGFAVQPGFVEAARLAGSHGLAVDLCVRRHQLPEVTRLVEQCPDVLFVLDHLGKPDVAAGVMTPWAGQLAALAAQQNTRCKLSGLTSEADPGCGDLSVVLPYLRHAIEVFGPDRCMFGSDWPNASLRVDYAGWVELVTAAASDLHSDDVDRILRGTAREVYGRAWSVPDAETEEVVT